MRVLEAAQFLSGPYCGMLLADMGAEVIKVERPGLGDVYRTYGPYFAREESSSFIALNRNKKSITLDLKNEKGREIFKRFVKDSDVVIENFRPDVMPRLGLDYSSLKTINERLIYCSISGYGQTGPKRDRGGFDLILQGEGGIMSLTGEDGGRFVKVGIPLLDIGAALFGAYGILAARMALEKTGKGQYVDTSLLDTSVALLLLAAQNYFTAGVVGKPMGSVSPLNAPYQAFTTKDGSITVGTGNEELWHRFCEVTGLEDLLKDPRFKTNANRVRNVKQLEEIIEKVMVERTSTQWLQGFESVGIPCGPINTVDRVFDDPQVIAREMVLEIDHPRAGRIRQVGIPVKLSMTPGSIRIPPPLLGQHTNELLRSIGYSDNEIQELHQTKIV
jgi:crotonobetainyl-CoA:carnitine CoA-transferase CaiB-like acyl-CoA transferase